MADRFGFPRDERGGVTVVVDGHPQSYVDLSDPGLLVFEYVAQIAAVIETMAPGPLRVTHVGGAGLTLPRWVASRRPGSPQIVLEPDAQLTDAVRRELPLPRGHRIRVRPQRGREGLAGLAGASADVVIVDAYAEGRVPGDLATVEAWAEVARVLAPRGMALANFADEPGAAYAHRVAASARAGLGPVALIGTLDVLKGRRFGNVVLVSGHVAPDDSALARAVAALSPPSGYWPPGEVTRRGGGAIPWRDGQHAVGPPPPEPGTWRLR